MILPKVPIMVMKGLFWDIFLNPTSKIDDFINISSDEKVAPNQATAMAITLMMLFYVSFENIYY